MKPSCNNLTTEDYSLWLLGQLEDPEASLIREHLDGDCPKCAEAIRQSAGFWSAFGVASASPATPSRRLRTRILAAIEDRPKKVIPIWRYAAAMAAGVVLMAAISWQLRSPAAAPDPRVADLQAKLTAAETEIARLSVPRPALPVAAPPVPAPVTAPPAPDRTPEFNQALADANQQIQKLQAALSQEQTQAQAQVARLTQQLDQQKTALATAEGSVTAANTKLTEQVRALEAKVSQLQRERDSVVEVLSRNKANYEQNTRLIALLSSPTVKLVRLAGTEAAPKATGYAILAEGRRLIFTGSGLPALPSGKVAQLWLLRGRGPAIVSAGTFQVSGDQTTIEFADPSALTDIRGLAVTEEPRGGSQLPTGHKLLIGTARS